MLRKLLLTLTLLTIAGSSNAQWTLIKQFTSDPRTVYFFPPVGGPRQVGLVAILESEVWRTVDGGVNWTKSTFDPPLETGAFPSYVVDFTFKNNNHGWAAIRHSKDEHRPSLYVTFDGGASWAGVMSQTGNSTGVHYESQNGRLIVADQSTGPNTSTDDGMTWSNISFFGFNIVAFADGMTGYMPPFDASSRAPSLITSDGGVTWAESTFAEETYQAAGISGSNELYCLSEITAKIFRSTDGGVTWAKLYDFSGTASQNNGVSGCLRVNGCGDLVLQHGVDGFMISRDRGENWTKIGGPVNSFDTRFQVLGTTIYAGETGGGVWKYETGTSASTTPELALTNNAKMTQVDPGKSADVIVKLNDALPSGGGLDSINIVLTYPEGVLTPSDPRVETGWTLFSKLNEPGRLSFTLRRSTQFAIPKGTPIATVAFITAVSSLDTGRVLLEQIRYNQNCSVAQNNSSDSVAIAVASYCGDETIRNFLNKRSLISGVAVHPNPAVTHSADAAVRFTMDHPAMVTLKIVSPIGREMFAETREYAAGAQEWLVPTREFASGAYTILLASDGEQEVLKLLIDR